MDDDEPHDEAYTACADCLQFKRIYKYGVCRDCYELGKAEYLIDVAKDERAEK